MPAPPNNLLARAPGACKSLAAAIEIRNAGNRFRSNRQQFLAMKRHYTLAGIVACGMAVTSFGAEATTMFWGFDTADNPAVGQPGENNPLPATGLAEVTPGFALGYFPGVPDIGLNVGTATGVWDIGGAGSGVQMDIDLFAATPEAKLDYTVVVRQFASTAPQVGFPYSPVVGFSIPGWTLESQVEQETTPNGTWIQSTYTWQQLSVGGPITLTMTADGSKGLLLDSIAFSVMGDLVPIPEPSVTQLGALAAFMFGLGMFRRRKTAA